MEISGIYNIQIKQQKAEKLIGLTDSKAKVKAATAQDQSVRLKQSHEELVQNIEEMLKFFESNSSIKFQYDKSINRIIIQVINSGNKEVIKQIPPESMVRFLQSFNELMGILVNKEI